MAKDGAKIEGMDELLADVRSIKTKLARLGKVDGESGIFEDYRAYVEGAPEVHPVKYMWWQNYGWTTKSGRKVAGRFWLQKAVEANKKRWIENYQAYAYRLAKGDPWDAGYMDSLMKFTVDGIQKQIVEDDVIDTTEGLMSVTYKVINRG